MIRQMIDKTVQMNRKGESKIRNISALEWSAVKEYKRSCDYGEI